MNESLYRETENYSWLKLDDLSAVPVDEVWMFEMKTYWGTANAAKPKVSLAPYFGSKPLYKFRQQAFYGCSLALFKETGLGHEVDLDVTVTLSDPINYMKAIEAKGLHLSDTEALLKDPLKAALEHLISLQPEQLTTPGGVSPFAAQDLRTGVLHRLLSSPDISLYLQNRSDFQTLGVQVQVSVNNIDSSLTYEKVLQQATYELNNKMPMLMDWLKRSVPFQMEKELAFREQVYTHVLRHYNLIFPEISPLLTSIIIKKVAASRVGEAMQPTVVSAVFKDLLRQELEKVKRTNNTMFQQSRFSPLQEQDIPLRSNRANNTSNVYPSLSDIEQEDDSLYITPSPQQLADLNIPPRHHISQMPTLQFERQQPTQHHPKRTINEEKQLEVQTPLAAQKQAGDAPGQRPPVQKPQSSSAQQNLAQPIEPDNVEQQPAQIEQASPIEDHTVIPASVPQLPTPAPHRYTQQDLEALRTSDEELPDPFIPDEQIEDIHKEDTQQVAQQLLAIRSESHELVKMLAESNKNLTQQFASSNNSLVQQVIASNNATAQQLANALLQILQQGAAPAAIPAPAEDLSEVANPLEPRKFKTPPVQPRAAAPTQPQRPAELKARRFKLPKKKSRVQSPKTQEEAFKSRDFRRPPPEERSVPISAILPIGSPELKPVPQLKFKRRPLEPLVAEDQDSHVNKNALALTPQESGSAKAVQNTVLPPDLAKVARRPLPEYIRDAHLRAERWGTGLEGQLKALYEAQPYEGWKISPSIHDILEKKQTQEGDTIDDIITIYIDIGDTFRVWVSVSSQYPKERPLIEVIRQTTKLPQLYVHEVLNSCYKGSYDLYTLIKALTEDVHTRKW